MPHVASMPRPKFGVPACVPPIIGLSLGPFCGALGCHTLCGVDIVFARSSSLLLGWPFGLCV